MVFRVYITMFIYLHRTKITLCEPPKHSTSQIPSKLFSNTQPGIKFPVFPFISTRTPTGFKHFLVFKTNKETHLCAKKITHYCTNPAKCDAFLFRAQWALPTNNNIWPQYEIIFLVSRNECLIAIGDSGEHCTVLHVWNISSLPL